jgi:hypothetical protein
LPRKDTRGNSGLPCPCGIEDPAPNGLLEDSGFLVGPGTEVSKLSDGAGLWISDEAAMWMSHEYVPAAAGGPGYSSMTGVASFPLPLEPME